MSNQLTKIRSQVMALSLNERLELVTLLWDSLTPDETAFPDDNQAVALARQRASELDTGTVAGLSHEEVMGSVDKVLDETCLSSRG